MISFFPKQNKRRRIVANLTTILNDSARNQRFFGENKVQDTPDGRFELVALFCTSIFCAMAQRGPEYSDLSQRLFDAVFKSFDQALRELGVGDMAVAKRIRKLSESFYGRQKSYMNHVYDNDLEALSGKIALNIFDKTTQIGQIEGELAQQALSLYSKLKSLSIKELETLQDLSSNLDSDNANANRAFN